MCYQQAISEFHNPHFSKAMLSANRFCDNKFDLHGSKKKSDFPHNHFAWRQMGQLKDGLLILYIKFLEFVVIHGFIV